MYHGHGGIRGSVVRMFSPVCADAQIRCPSYRQVQDVLRGCVLPIPVDCCEVYAGVDRCPERVLLKMSTRRVELSLGLH